MNLSDIVQSSVLQYTALSGIIHAALSGIIHAALSGIVHAALSGIVHAALSGCAGDWVLSRCRLPGAVRGTYCCRSGSALRGMTGRLF